jgi:hypothetical protein
MNATMHKVREPKRKVLFCINIHENALLEAQMEAIVEISFTLPLIMSCKADSPLLTE